MAKCSNIARESKSGRFIPSKIGASKATKFALVEGVRLNEKSLAASALTLSSGMKGDAYREAITGQFLAKRAK